MLVIGVVSGSFCGFSPDNPDIEQAVERLQAERIESIKAGGLSALVCATVVMTGAIANTLLASRWSVLTVLSLNWAIFLHLANAVLAGFLFGVTYRYVVRQGENPHLSSGAVLAFALVRGLAQLETGWTLHGNPTLLLLLGGESLLMMAIAAVVLNFALSRKAILPFVSF